MVENVSIIMYYSTRYSQASKPHVLCQPRSQALSSAGVPEP